MQKNLSIKNFLVRNYFERNETEFFRVFLTFIMSEKEIGDYFSMLFARVAVGLFFGGKYSGKSLIFAKKSRQGKFKCANWSKFPAKSLKYIQEKFFLAHFYQFNLKLVN